MSRIISGKLRLDVQQVDLADVVKSAIASVRHAAEAKGIRFHVVLDPLAGPVRGDPARLQQCVWNLLANAVKFTPRGGQVQVALERVNSHLELCVTDDGEGISSELLPHLFERFHQGDASTTRRHGGLGLGLSIVKNLIELHGDTIRAKSPGAGSGSTFCIELPLLFVHGAPEDTRRTHPRAHAAIRKIRALPAEQGGRTLAAALTAFARAEDRTRALRARYQTHVAKPVEPSELAAVVASLAARP